MYKSKLSCKYRQFPVLFGHTENIHLYNKPFLQIYYGQMLGSEYTVRTKFKEIEFDK